MSRFIIHTDTSAPEAARAGVQTALANNGYIPNLIGLLANAPTALETYQTVSGINARSSLSLQEREVVQLTAATTHGCTFCVAGHTAIAKNKAQLPERTIEALRLSQAIADPRLNALALFTLAVIQHRGRVDDAGFKDFLAAGFTHQQALEVVLGVSLATLCNFANNLAGTPLNPELEAYRWTPAT